MVTSVMTRKDVRNGESLSTLSSALVRSVAVMYMMMAEQTALPSHRMTGKTMTSHLYEKMTRQRYISEYAQPVVRDGSMPE